MEDYHNFSESASPTRLPALSGAQLLADFISKNRPISTNLNALDKILGREVPLSKGDGTGGVLRSSVTEIFGPSGSGKTAFGMQLAANAASTGSTVVWIDCATELPISRLRDMVQAKASRDTKSQDGVDGKDQLSKDLMDNFKHLKLLRMPFLFAVIAQAPAGFPPPGTSLMVIDDLSSLVLSSLLQAKSRAPPGAGSASAAAAASRDEILRKENMSRRSSLIANIASALHKLAASKNIALVVLNGMSILQRTGAHALLRPSLNTPSWVAAMSTRLGLYRDFWPDEDPKQAVMAKEKDSSKPPFRIVRVEQLSGKDMRSDSIPFIITTEGISPAFMDAESVPGIALSQKYTASILDEEPRAINTTVDQEIGFDELRSAHDAYLGSETGIAEAEAAAARTKRKVDEIMDSEDDDIDYPSKDEIKLPNMPKPQGGFLPSSQLMQEQTQKEADSSLTPHPQPILEKASSSDVQKSATPDDDMLLRPDW